MLRVGRERSAGAGPSLFTVVVRSDQAEHAAQPLSKGSRVVVVGRLQWRSWTAKDGGARSGGRGAGAEPALGDGDAHQEHLGAVGIGRGPARAQLADSARHASTSVIAWAVLWNSTARIPSRLAATTLASRSSRNTTSPGASCQPWHVIL